METLTVEKIHEHSKDPNQGFDICSKCDGVQLANTMEEVGKISLCNENHC